MQDQKEISKGGGCSRGNIERNHAITQSASAHKKTHPSGQSIKLQHQQSIGPTRSTRTAHRWDEER
jgi:hypothetical protein